MIWQIFSEVFWIAFKPSCGAEGRAQPPAMKEMAKVNLAEKLDLFNEHWSPKIVGEVLSLPIAHSAHAHTHVH